MTSVIAPEGEHEHQPMAHKPKVEPRSVSEQFLEELTRCAVCLDTYADPRLLACAHRYCLACLHGLAARCFIKCPECRAQSRIPPGGIDALPRDFIINNLIDHLDDLTEDNDSGPSQDIDENCAESVTSEKNCLLRLKKENRKSSISFKDSSLSRSRRSRLRRMSRKQLVGHGLRNSIHNFSLALTDPLGSMLRFAGTFARAGRVIMGKIVDFYFLPMQFINTFDIIDI